MAMSSAVLWCIKYEKFIFSWNKTCLYTEDGAVLWCIKYEKFIFSWNKTCLDTQRMVLCCGVLSTKNSYFHGTKLV